MAEQAGKDSIGSSLNILEKLEGEEREKFVHKAINDICEKAGLKYDDHFKLLPLADYSNLTHNLSLAIRTLSRDQLKKEQLMEKLQAMGTNPDIAQVVVTCMWVRRDEIRAQLVKDSCNISQAKLENFDWKLKLIMSSNQLGSIQQPVMSLDFEITENGQKRVENIELSKDELSKFIASLEPANRVVTQLRT